MTTYKIVRGTLSLGTAGTTLGVQSGGVMFDFPTNGWRACLKGNDLADLQLSHEECSLAVDLEGGGKLRGMCSVVEVEARQAQVESGSEPDQFVEPTIIEAE
jgi:hypothetical protein